MTLYDPFIWAYIEFWVEYSANVQQIQDIAVQAVFASPHFVNYEPPGCWIMDMNQTEVQVLGGGLGQFSG